MKQLLRYTLFLIPLLALIVVLLFAGSEKNDSIPVLPQEPHSFTIYNVSIPDTLAFAGEQVPLANFDVRESLDRELNVNVYWHSSTIFLIKRANRYFPVIEPILKKNNVPDDFKYLAVAESGLLNAVSPSDAAGYWQFLKAVAKENGLEVDLTVDERYHIEKSTEAACRFLTTAYNQFGSWAMAAAAYNAGKSGIAKYVTNQKQSNYYDLYMNEETARYVFRILAIKLILENPAKYGFHIDGKELYAPFEYTEVAVDSSITSLADFAKQMGTNYKMLKIFNPWLRDFNLVNKHKKTYYIKIPKQGFRETMCLEK